MNTTRTAEQNGQPADASDPTILDCGTTMYAILQTMGLSREDILYLLCGVLLVAVCGDNPRKPRREEGRRARTKGPLA